MQSWGVWFQWSIRFALEQFYRSENGDENYKELKSLSSCLFSKTNSSSNFPIFFLPFLLLIDHVQPFLFFLILFSYLFCSLLRSSFFVLFILLSSFEHSVSLLIGRMVNWSISSSFVQDGTMAVKHESQAQVYRFEKLHKVKHLNWKALLSYYSWDMVCCIIFFFIVNIAHLKLFFNWENFASATLYKMDNYFTCLVWGSQALGIQQQSPQRKT